MKEKKNDDIEGENLLEKVHKEGSKLFELEIIESSKESCLIKSVGSNFSSNNLWHFRCT